MSQKVAVILLNLGGPDSKNAIRPFLMNFFMDKNILTIHKVETSMICCYPENQGYVDTSVKHIAKEYKQAVKDGHENPRVLFSAHGLPEKVIKKGDPYQSQCERAR